MRGPPGPLRRSGGVDNGSRVDGLFPGLLGSGGFHIECSPRRLHERRVFFPHSRFVDGRKAMSPVSA